MAESADGSNPGPPEAPLGITFDRSRELWVAEIASAGELISAAARLGDWQVAWGIRVWSAIDRNLVVIEQLVMKIIAEIEKNR